MRLTLTDQQKSAATAAENRVYIEASPGSGKTTVATERFGVNRYGSDGHGRGVIALSFARSARGELERRVRQRWGLDAMRWPHQVWTLDSLHCALVGHLLRSGVIEWPGGETDLTVVDSWRGSSGARPRDAGEFVRTLALNGRRVVTRAVRAAVAGTYFTQKAPYVNRLSEGICTHDEIRQVLQAALPRGSAFREPLREYFKATARSLIVDEVFDGNLIDLQVVSVASATGVPTTLIGDPWQALYAFRGARPDLVPQLISQLGFVDYPIEQSFRFETPAMQALTSELRRSHGVSVPHGTIGETNVVLASSWKALWSAPDVVLPFSFGQAANRTDAALALLLDFVIGGQFGESSTFGPDASVILDLDRDSWRSAAPAALAPVLERLSDGSDVGARAALDLLRGLLVDFGSAPIRRLAGRQEAKRVARLVHLGRRLAVAQPVPGLTIHQAKGREWPRVGVVLNPTEHARLASGLTKDSEVDRALYVALTRARRAVIRYRD